MRVVPPARLCLALLALLGGSPRLHAEMVWFSDPNPQVLTVTDVTPAGRSFVAPTPERPVYYRAITYGCDFGSIAGDKLPGTKRMTKYIVKILAEQGFQGADAEHEPTLFLAFQWGYLRGSLDQKLIYLGGSKFDLMWETRDDKGNTLPWMRRAARPPEVQKIMDIAEAGDLYALTISAFEFASVEVDNRPILLWQTRIACSASGNYMVNAMPRLAATAGPLIGRETTTPVWKRPDEGPKGKVEFGDLEVIGIEEDLRK